MPRKSAIDQPTRLRIAAHLRRAYSSFERDASDRGEVATQQDFADKLGLDAATVSRILRGKNDSLGFDVVLSMRRGLGLDYEAMLEQDTEPHFMRPLMGDGRRGRLPVLPEGEGARDATHVASMVARVPDKRLRKHLADMILREIQKNEKQGRRKTST